MPRSLAQSRESVQALGLDHDVKVAPLGYGDLDPVKQFQMSG